MEFGWVFHYGLPMAKQDCAVGRGEQYVPHGSGYMIHGSSVRTSPRSGPVRSGQLRSGQVESQVRLLGGSGSGGVFRLTTTIKRIPPGLAPPPSMAHHAYLLPWEITFHFVS